jgi:hypothetical protein
MKALTAIGDSAANAKGLHTGIGSAPIHTLDDRLRDIELIGERINGIVRFMCDSANLPGTSGEGREKAVTAFHERLIVMEKQLVRIQDNLRLG